jgi:Domain of unknown function (DUF397)
VQNGRFIFGARKFRSGNSAPDWTKSSLSYANGACVEVAGLGSDFILVRDSKKKARGPVLRFTQAEWDAFLGGVRLGEFDRTQPPGSAP